MGNISPHAKKIVDMAIASSLQNNIGRESKISLILFH